LTKPSSRVPSTSIKSSSTLSRAFLALSLFIASAAAHAAPPTAPTGLTATVVSATQIDLNWNASTDDFGVARYRIYRCQGSSCTNFSLVGTSTVTSFSDTGRAPGTTYRYRVRAVDGARNVSPSSNTVSATTLGGGSDTTAPSAPTGLAATAVSASQVNLIWNAATDDVGVTGYRVFRCAGASCTNFAQVATATATSFNNTGLAAGTTYRYRVSAFDAAGNVSQVSNTVSATTQTTGDATAPSVPTGLFATAASGTEITVVWNASTDNVGVAGYRVERCQGAGCSTFVQVGTSPMTSFNSTGLKPSTSYSFRVRATDAAGNLSGYSNVASATTTATSPTVSLSANPTSITSGGSSTLTWSATNATSCSASNAWSGTKPVSGSETIGPIATTSTFTLVCSGAGGSASQSATVTVGEASAAGLDFPRNDQVADGQTVRFKFTNPHQRGLPIYGPGGHGVTYIFKVMPKPQAGYYTTFFWGNDDGNGNLNTFFWGSGPTGADTYYGAHPYPDSASGQGTTHKWSIAAQTADWLGAPVDYNRWYTQAVRVWADGSGKHHEFYWDLPSTDSSRRITHTSPNSYGNTNPPAPTLTFGDAPWSPGRELCSCVLRGIQIYSSLLSLEDIQAELASPMSTPAGSASIWYLNLNPTPTDIADKSGRGNHPQWVGTQRPGLWSE
jgi:fibronectin type 3 domain-containing protein